MPYGGLAVDRELISVNARNIAYLNPSGSQETGLGLEITRPGLSSDLLAYLAYFVWYVTWAQSIDQLSSICR